LTAQAWPTHRVAWTMTVLLTLAYILSFVDRYILGLLIEPIKADLGLTDEQIGYLIGPAFGLFYATVGVPLGWLADRKTRTHMVAAGIAFWSLATAASGLASNFWHLFFARMSVGVGEATLSPCAISIIGDSFPPERRGRPVAMYSAAQSLGAGLAALIGAGVLIWAKQSQVLSLPVLGELKPWQFAFVAVGLPGLLLAIPFLVLREPPRRKTSVDATGRQTFGDTMRYIWARRGAFLGIATLVAVMTTTAYAQGFLPSAFKRTYGWEAHDYAIANGIMTLAFGPATVATVGIMIDRLRARGVVDAPFNFLAIGIVAMIPLCAMKLLMPNVWLSLVCIGLSIVAIATVTGSGIIALLDVTPASARGQIVGLFYMFISIAGLSLGPTSVGLFSTRVFGEQQLNLAFSVVPVMFGIIPLLCLPLIRRAYRRELAQLGG
jgi:MFS family permease